MRCTQTEERLTALALIHMNYETNIDKNRVCKLFLISILEEWKKLLFYLSHEHFSHLNIYIYLHNLFNLRLQQREAQSTKYKKIIWGGYVLRWCAARALICSSQNCAKSAWGPVQLLGSFIAHPITQLVTSLQHSQLHNWMNLSQCNFYIHNPVTIDNKINCPGIMVTNIQPSFNYVDEQFNIIDAMST